MDSRRILFVDADRETIQKISKVILDATKDWECEIVGSAAEGLDRLDSAHFDAVITEVVLPDLDGIEFLNRTKKRHPEVIRLILSEETNRNTVLRALEATHQYLLKPCIPMDLLSVLQHAFAIQHAVPNTRLQKLLGKLTRIPSMPACYQELQAALSSGDATFRDIGRIISKDPGLTARILKMVHSAYFGLPRGVVNIDQAAAFLGTDFIKSLVLTLELFTKYEQAGISRAFLDRLFEHSLLVAGLTRALAKEGGLSATEREMAFTAGLLHDVGKLILAENQAEEYQSVMELQVTYNINIWQAEWRVFGVTHAEVGAYLLSLWGFPDEQCNAVRFHHQPHLSKDNRFTILTAVHLANAFGSIPREDLYHTRRRIHIPYIEQIGGFDDLPAWEQACLNLIAVAEEEVI